MLRKLAIIMAAAAALSMPISAIAAHKTGGGHGSGHSYSGKIGRSSGTKSFQSTKHYTRREGTQNRTKNVGTQNHTKYVGKRNRRSTSHQSTGIDITATGAISTTAYGGVMELGLAGHMTPSMTNTIGYAAISVRKRRAATA